MHFENPWQNEYYPLKIAFRPRHHLIPNDLRNFYPLKVGIDLVIYVTVDVLFVLLLDADLVSTFQSNERIVSARETYRNGIRKGTKELDKFSGYIFTALVKRINVNPDWMCSCRIDHVPLEEALQLFLVPVPFCPKLSLGLTSILVKRSES